MGNQWIKDYDIGKKPYSHGGVRDMWNIHHAKKVKEEYSVFIFDKRTLDKTIKNDMERENVLKTLRNEFSKLAQLKHPYILSVIEAQAEDAKRIICVTEPVQGSLMSLIQNDKLGQLSVLDIKLHMLQIIEGLCFLHNDAKLIHTNISPENIYVTISGKWKLGGIIYSVPLIPNHELYNVHVDLNPKPYDNVIVLRPNLSYLSPEMANKPPQVSLKSDIFSLGLLFGGLLRYQSTGLKELALFELHTISQYEASFDYLIPFIQKSQFYLNIQDNILKELLMRMLLKDQGRPSIVEIYHSEFFMDPLIRLMYSIRVISQFDVDQQCALLKSISKNIYKFEKQVIIQDILPIILPRITNDQLMSPIIFIIIDLSKMTEQSIQSIYYNKCWNALKSITSMPSMPAQALYALVQNIKQFYDIKIPPIEIQTCLIPLYIKCFESSVPKLQQICLLQTQYIFEHLPYQSTKTTILPRLLQLCLDNTDKETNLIAIQVLKDTHNIIDIVSIYENVLPTLDRMRKEQKIQQESAELIYDIYKSVITKLNSEQIVNQLLPSLLPFLIEKQISKQLVLKYSQLIQEHITLITNAQTYQEQQQQQQNILQQPQQPQQQYINQPQIPINPPEQQPNELDYMMFDFSSLTIGQPIQQPQVQPQIQPQPIVDPFMINYTNTINPAFDPFSNWGKFD